MSFLAHIDDIIKRMGYAKSSCLRYRHDGYTGKLFPAHTSKILSKLAPYAVYFVDTEPFVLFWDERAYSEKSRQLNRKIWNAQIPIAIVCGSSDVKIYNGYSINKEESILPLIHSIPVDLINEESPFSYWDITNHNFWVKYANKFSGKRLNDCLLSNLSDITSRLRESYNISFATKLVLRLIFIRYLIDRGVDLDYAGFSYDVSSSRASLLKILKNKKELYALFSHLKDKFNGNLFEFDNEIFDASLTADALQLLYEFLSANVNTKTGQLSFFDMYDFNIIPVELISNIYEILLGSEKRNRYNAFYTPQYLVNYILDASVSPFVRDYGSCKVLDPACGSGIFLVESYRRMVEKELRGDQFTEDNELLQRLLVENIFGIDLNEEAIDVTIFSLYLAMLDYKNPKTLKKFNLPNLKGSNLLVNDFFDKVVLARLRTMDFDFIIGNPPWGKGNELQANYCKENGYSSLMQNNDTCRGFILRSKDFCNNNTQCCFVLHSTMLYMQNQPSKNLRRYLLKNTEIIRIIELSSVRKLIFKNADAPAVVLSFKFDNRNVQKNRFEYISIKPNIFFRLFGIIVVERNDIKQVEQRLLIENDWVWKTLVYGLTGDIDTILKLKQKFPSVRQAIKEQNPELLLGAGVEPQKGDRNDSKHLMGRPFLSSNSIEHFYIDEQNIGIFDRPEVHRPRDERLFTAPYCLVLTGIDTKRFTMRAVYSDKDFVFRKAIYAIKGTFEQKNFLLNLTGLLNSELFAYFNLMTGSSVGVEREQRIFNEILEFPYTYSDNIANQAALLQELSQQGATTAMEAKRLNMMILKEFGLSDNKFVDYALNIQIPQLTESYDSEAYRSVKDEDLKIYSELFYTYLSTIFEPSHKYILVTIYPSLNKYYSAVEITIQRERPSNWYQVSNNNDALKATLAQFSLYKINDMFFYIKDVIYFGKDSFCIVKPNFYKNWHPAISQLDMIEIVDQILSREGGNG
jgi:type I restriction-modification system DNA methylase subunit